MVTLDYYDALNISFESALVSATIFFDGFRDDIFFKTFHPELFGKTASPGHERVLERISRSWARLCVLGILQGTQVLCIASDSGKPVAMALYELPDHQTIKPSIFQRLWRVIYWCWASIMSILEGAPDRIINDQNYHQFLTTMKSCGSMDGKASNLASMSYRELFDAPYPLRNTLYLEVLAVRFNEQNKGYGTLLVASSLDHFGKYLSGPIFVDSDRLSQGPAKVSVHPSWGKEQFYRKLGFKTIDSKEAMVGDHPVCHNFMQRLL